MGHCSTSLLSYGIIIPVPRVVRLLKALRNISPSPADKGSTHEDTDEDTEEDTDELSDLVRGQLAKIKLNKGEERPYFDFFPLRNEELKWKGVVTLYNGLYDGKEDHSYGLMMQMWGMDNESITFKRIVKKPWEDEKFKRAAAQAFKHFTELPSVKEAEVKVDPDWLSGMM